MWAILAAVRAIRVNSRATEQQSSGAGELNFGWPVPPRVAFRVAYLRVRGQSMGVPCGRIEGLHLLRVKLQPHILGQWALPSAPACAVA